MCSMQMPIPVISFFGELIPAHDLSLLLRPIRYCFMSTEKDAALLGLASAPEYLPLTLPENSAQS